MPLLGHILPALNKTQIRGCLDPLLNSSMEHPGPAGGDSETEARKGKANIVTEQKYYHSDI